MENKYFNNKYKDYSYIWRKADLNFAWFIARLNKQWAEQWPKETNKVIWRFLTILNSLFNIVLIFCQVYVNTKFNFLKKMAEIEAKQNNNYKSPFKGLKSGE